MSSLGKLEYLSDEWQAIAYYHSEGLNPLTGRHCRARTCEQAFGWPCQTRRLLEALNEALGELEEQTDFWVDNVQEVLDVALRVEATEVIRTIDEFYMTPDGKKRLLAALDKELSNDS